MSKCPKCGNIRDNVTINYCTICNVSHIDKLCGACELRWSIELPPPKQNEANETKRIAE